MKIERKKTKEHTNIGSLSFGDVFTLLNSRDANHVYIYVSSTTITAVSLLNGATFDIDYETKVILHPDARLILGSPKS